jgi:hypothetical protein
MGHTREALVCSLARFSSLALVIAACRAAFRTSGLAFLLAMMEARSAPTIPRYTKRMSRLRRHGHEMEEATSSARPFLCIRL